MSVSAYGPRAKIPPCACVMRPRRRCRHHYSFIPSEIPAAFSPYKIGAIQYGRRWRARTPSQRNRYRHDSLETCLRLKMHGRRSNSPSRILHFFPIHSSGSYIPIYSYISMIFLYTLKKLSIFYYVSLNIQSCPMNYR